MLISSGGSQIGKETEVYQMIGIDRFVYAEIFKYSRQTARFCNGSVVQRV